MMVSSNRLLLNLPGGPNILDSVLKNNDNMRSGVGVGGQIDCRKIRFYVGWGTSYSVLFLDFSRAIYEGLHRHLKEVNCKSLGNGVRI